MAGTKTRRLAGSLGGAGSAHPGLLWSSFLRAEGVFSASGPGRIPVLLVVLTLFFCHGAFGYAHQVSSVEMPAEGGVHAESGVHAVGVHEAGQDGDAEGSHPGGAYFAVLLLVLFGAALLLGGGVPAGGRLPVPGPGMGRRSRRPRPPRGPTIPRLQVFRL